MTTVRARWRGILLAMRAWRWLSCCTLALAFSTTLTQCLGDTLELDETACTPSDASAVDLLSDDANCGRCGRSCLGQACGSGMCTPEQLGTGVLPDQIYDIALDATSVYFANGGFATSMTKAGGPFLPLAEVQGVPISGVAVDESYFYCLSLFQSALYRIPKLGGNPETFATLSVFLSHIVLDQSFAYVSNHGKASEGGGYVEKIPLDGTTPTQMLNIDGVAALALDATTVYAATPVGIYRVDKDGQKQMLLVSNDGNNSVVADASYVYFSTLDGLLQRVQKTGGTVDTFPGPLEGRGKLLIHGDRIYWRSASAVRSTKLDMSEVPQTLVENYPYVPTNALAIDDTYVYFLAKPLGENHVYRTPL